MTLEQIQVAHPGWHIWRERDRYIATPMWPGALLDRREAPTLDELALKLRFSERTRP